ncbi:MAG: ATP-binding protein [Alistipes sp.]
MQRQLKNTVDPQLRTDILLNLKDLHEDTPQGLSFSIRLFEAAYNSHDAYAASVALHPIVTRFSTYGEKRDSLKYYLEQFHHITRFTDQAEMSFFYHTLSQFEVFNIKGSSKKSLLDLCDSIRAEQKPIPNGTTGQKIGRLFLIGYTGWYQRVLTGEKNCGIGGIGVWKEAWILARQLPPNAKRSFMSLIYRYLSSGYTQAHNYQGVLRIAKDYIGALDDYYQSETVRRRRPFLYKDNLYVIAYTHMMRGALYIGDKELAYRHYQNLEHRLLSAKGDALRRNKIYLYESGAMLLSDLNRQEEAISYCDSLITMIENGQAGSYNRETIYRHRALLLHRSGRDEESCQAYERSMAVSDSMLTSEYNSRLDAIRQDRQVDSLRLDEVHLVVRSRYTQLLALMGLLLISIIVGIYWLYSLRANRKLQQEILRQNHKAQESERMKSAFIHSICKDIHIPFNKIREAARQLTQPHQIDPVTVQVYRESIYDNTKHLLSILDTLLETAKLDSLSEGLSLQITDMAAICQAEIDMARHRSKRAKVNFQCIIDDDECLAFTHPQYATFVIRSLLSNAEKFTKEGSITLHCRHLTDQNCMQITVTDTGCGIPADKYEYIFEKFAKLDTATIGGGLSLALCRQIAQQLHSTLSIDPSYTTGARFVFTLPLPPPPPENE